MTKLKIAATVISLVVLGACSAEPHEFVPGQPPKFPLSAVPALEHLGKGLLRNCESSDENLTATCARALQERSVRCLPGPTVVKGKDEYRELMRKYLACAMPRPICRGVELEPNATASDCPRT